MFGIAVARLDQVSDAEKERYQALYCGLCRALKRRYGQVSRAALSYDLAFLALFLDSLTEPPEQRGSAHCPAHPKKRMPYAESAYSDYAADLSVALAYHKCLDDVADEGGVRAHAAERALRGQYAKAQERIPGECAAIQQAMDEIRALEGAADTPPDACARVFGQLMGRLFAAGCAWQEPPAAADGAQGAAAPAPASASVPALDGAAWAPAAGAFGALLGRFVYLMDAAVDYAADARSGSYNPFVALGATPAQMREVLAVLAADMAEAFERLPLVQDAHLMRSVLYAGVWQKFNHTYKDQFADDPTEGASQADG